MDDLISRQAAIAEFSCCELTPDGGIDANYAIDFLENMPSAPLVRCRDCKHYESDGGAMMICNITDMVGDDDDYCSYGVREEGE